MNRLRHVNFRNDATFHAYAWIVSSGEVDWQDMVEAAFDRADVGPDLKAVEGEPLFDVELHLANLLRHKFDSEYWPELCGENGRPEAPMDYVPGDLSLCLGDPDVLRGLLFPLVAFAAMSIDWGAIGEALLRDAGKWNPED